MILHVSQEISDHPIINSDCNSGREESKNGNNEVTCSEMLNDDKNDLVGEFDSVISDCSNQDYRISKQGSYQDNQTPGEKDETFGCVVDPD